MSGITKVSKFVLGDNSVSLSKLDATGAAVGKVLAVGIGNTLQFEDKLVTEDVEDIAAGLILRGNHTNLSVSYIDGTNQLDLAVSGLATVSTSGSYNDLTDTPTNVSVFINDAGYLTINDGYATETYVDTEISNLVASAPATLDTLNELAAALGDDPNFATTIATNISTKVSKSGDTMTGDLLIDSTDAEINLKAGDVGTSAALNWTFNTAGTNYASIKLPYDTRASTGLHIDSGYPITIDATTRIDFDISGTTYASLDTSGLSVGANTVFHDGYHPNADKWTTARTLSLSGDASGSVSWDGSANATLSVTVADDSHSHSNYITSNADDTWSGDISTNSTNGIRFGNANQSDTNDGTIAAGRFSSGLNIVGTQTTAGSGRQVRIWGDVITDVGNKFWHAGNDGSGSGLDADTLDGLHASEIGGGSTTFGDVGTYAFLRYTPNLASISPNTNYAGSSLQYTSIHRSAGNNILMPTNGGSPSGTWRSMGGGTNNVFGGTNWPATLFVRIS